MQEVFELYKKEKEDKQKHEKKKSKKLAAYGFEGELQGEGIL